MKTELHVPSELRFLNIVENWLLGCLEMDLGESVDWARQSNRLRLVLAEAFSNVVRHAHRDRPHLPVWVRLELKDSDICLEVWDYGRGYNLNEYMAPTPEAMQEGGYGWLIMNRLMDHVEYTLQVDMEGRNCLKLEANLVEKSETSKTKA
ncbi:ATP-binding protein [Sodalinema gerasimenkoae]|uniref:ATP-binding protein n=1 Tax=Sodalinema gerasimenkoae TaxID=2862348 RepID=UPI00135BB497|nr:anti-sigma regulatory factor [Sodalinema gerasimenkoae]MCC5898510.1 anti-sigma regulatory factor [Phormidium sp. BM_Day4_Bin.17]TVR14409.1 MAG: anti-sigma regulatory factor [Phormidium sp. GEM2.Bin31]UCJ11676.1 MAG: anti-sigma regulatory factor [Phormidium sp. PBR-2020]